MQPDWRRFLVDIGAWQRTLIDSLRHFGASTNDDGTRHVFISNSTLYRDPSGVPDRKEVAQRPPQRKVTRAIPTKPAANMPGTGLCHRRHCRGSKVKARGSVA